MAFLLRVNIEGFFCFEGNSFSDESNKLVSRLNMRNFEDI